MTRTPARRLLVLALATALAPVPALSALAQSANPFSLGGAPTNSPQPDSTPLSGAFTVSDIRIDGLQRISAGTVFTYLPIERGDTIDQSRAAEAIRALYKTGFFEDVRLDRQGNILVVTVTERPAINKLTLEGNKDIKTPDLQKGLTDIGLAEGNTFDRLSLDRVTQELTRQYNNRGKYNVEITPAVTRLDRNRGRRHHPHQGRQSGQDPPRQPDRQRAVQAKGHHQQLGVQGEQLAELLPAR